MSSSTIYTIDKIDDLQPYSDLVNFFYDIASDVEEIIGVKALGFFDFRKFAREEILWVARRKGEPVGCLLANIRPHFWNPTVRVLWNHGLFVKSPNQRAAHMLLSTFIDFGRKNADLVFTARRKQTNVKESSFVRLGFLKSEEVFLLRSDEHITNREPK